MIRSVGPLFVLSLAACSLPSPGVDFCGSRTHAVVADGTPFSASSISVSLWVRLDQLCGPQVFASHGSRAVLFTLELDQGKVRMSVHEGMDHYTVAVADPPEPGVWTHFVGTADGDRVRIYRQGILAGEKSVFLPPFKGIPTSSPIHSPLYLGAGAPAENAVLGAMRDVRIFATALSADQVAALHRGEQVASDALLGSWQDATEDRWEDCSGHDRAARFGHAAVVRKADEIRGIWYSNQKSGDEYRFKYAGGFATYPQQHLPIAIHSAAAQRTYFTYGAADENNRLLHAVSYFDHATGQIARPTILLAKQTSDAHDNPVLSLDDRGYLWVFSPSHGTARPSFLHRSTRPHDIESFDRVRTTNFSYPQPWFVPGEGFCFLHTVYDGRRTLCWQRSEDGQNWSERRVLASFGRGHYQVSGRRGGRVATVFNYHPEKGGLNARTNLYYLESGDGGRSWQTVTGETVTLPLRSVDNPARIAEYESKGRLVYLKDLQFDQAGRPVIVYLTSGGYAAGPANDPRRWRIRCWDGSQWLDHEITTSDHNYDFGSIYLEAPDRWRLIAPTAPGPQPYGTGGEMVMWESRDRGRTWSMLRQLTDNSPRNHTYLRRPVDAQPGFYGLWADGDARKQSGSSLWYTTRDGVVTRMR